MGVGRCHLLGRLERLGHRAAAGRRLLAEQGEHLGFLVLRVLSHRRAELLEQLRERRRTGLQLLQLEQHVGAFGLLGRIVTKAAGIPYDRYVQREIIAKLNEATNAALSTSSIKARFADLGATVFPGSPPDFGKFIADDTEKWAKVVKFAGIKVE